MFNIFNWFKKRKKEEQPKYNKVDDDLDFRVRSLMDVCSGKCTKVIINGADLSSKYTK